MLKNIVKSIHSLRYNEKGLQNRPNMCKKKIKEVQRLVAKCKDSYWSKPGMHYRWMQRWVDQRWEWHLCGKKEHNVHTPQRKETRLIVPKDDLQGEV